PRPGARWRRRASEIALALLALHRRLGVIVDQPPLPLGAARLAPFGDDLANGRGLRLDSPAQRVAAECPKPHPARFGRLARLQRQAVVIDHDPHPAALYDRPRLGEVE